MNTSLIITTICIFVLVLLLKNFGKKVRKHYTKDKKNEKLADPLQDYLPDLRKHYIYAEYLWGFIIIFAVIFGLIYYKTCLGYEICFMLVIFHLVKQLCSMVTILPDPSDMCEQKETSGNCNDLMPSGHMSTLLIILFSFWPYMNTSWKSLFVFLVLLYSVLIIAVRNHYTIDVVMSWFVVFTIYSIVHPYILNNFTLTCI